MAAPSAGFGSRVILPTVADFAKNVYNAPAPSGSMSNNSASGAPLRSNLTPMGSPLPFSMSQNQQRMMRDDIAKVQTQMVPGQTLPTPRKNSLPPPANIFPRQANPVPLQFQGDDPNATKFKDEHGREISLKEQADRDEKSREEAARKKPTNEPDGFATVERNVPKPPKPQTGSLLGASGMRINSGRWAQLNPGTTSCSNSRVAVTNPSQEMGAGVTFAQRPSEDVLRSLTINAMTEMNKAPMPASWDAKKKPSVMGILVGLGTQNAPDRPQMEATPTGGAEVPKDTRTGWQVYLHSNTKGSPPGGSQAKLHPLLLERLKQLKLNFHHFSGMCAEMGLLTNYLYDNPNALATGQFPPDSVYMMTYTASDFSNKDPGVGKFLKPCNHKNCGKQGALGSGGSGLHDLNPSHHGCQQVFDGLGIQQIGPGGVVSETVEVIIKEQEQRAASMRDLGAQASAATSPNPNPSTPNRAQPNQPATPSPTPNSTNTARKPPPTTANPTQTPTNPTNPTRPPPPTNLPRAPSQTPSTSFSYANVAKPPPKQTNAAPSPAPVATGSPQPQPQPQPRRAQGNQVPVGGGKARS